MLLASLGLFSQWSGNGLVSYYATDVYESIGIKNTDLQLIFTGGLTTMSLIVSVSCAMLVDRVGRRPLFITATGSMCVCFILWSYASAQQQEKQSMFAGRAVIALIWLFNFCYALAWTGLLVAYTVEILPFKIRAKGLMVMNVFIQVSLAINQYVNPLGFKYLKPAWKLYTIYAVSTHSFSSFHFFLSDPRLTFSSSAGCSLPRAHLRLLLLHRNARPHARRDRTHLRLNRGQRAPPRPQIRRERADGRTREDRCGTVRRYPSG